MNDVTTIGRWVLLGGVILVIVGGLIMLAGRIPGTDRLGRLPGDVRWTSASGNLSCFVPITSMILLSIVLTVVLNLVVRLLNR